MDTSLNFKLGDSVNQDKPASFEDAWLKNVFKQLLVNCDKLESISLT